MKYTNIFLSGINLKIWVGLDVEVWLVIDLKIWIGLDVEVWLGIDLKVNIS